MKISDYIVSYFVEKKVKKIFGYIGGAITHIIDSIDKNDSIDFVQTYHEQTAAIAAEGYARATNNIGVAIATSGPGATNLITGIADAFFDSIPVIYITGQVNTYEYKFDKPIRQQGFQEMDVVSIVSSITKYAKLITDPANIPYELDKAYKIATSGRPGPVLLDIPMNIQRSLLETNDYKKFQISKKHGELSLNDEVIEIIHSAKKPIILIGGGCNTIEESLKNKFHKYINEKNIPVLCSLMGKGLINENIESFIGMLGSYGNRCANMSLEKCDLLIAIGSRLDTRQTGAKYKNFIENGKIIQIDIDEQELNYHRIDDKHNLNMTASDFITQLLNLDISIDKKWSDYISKLKLKYNQSLEINNFVENKSPYRLMEKLNKISPKDTCFVADIGQNQMWSAQTLEIDNSKDFFTSGGLAPMGYSIPFAVGYSLGKRTRNIISISGDGGFHMSTQALMLMKQYNLPIKAIVINNHSLGMITQFQSLYFNGNLAATTETGGYMVPDMKGFCKAYSLKYYKLTEESLIDSEKIFTIFNSDEPCVIEYVIDGLTTVSPKLEFDSPIYRPSPKI